MKRLRQATSTSSSSSSLERSLLDHIALAQDLKDLLGREVDVVTAKGLHWYVRDRVCREAVPL
ncbi:hypothetical protein [Methanoculleus chikugoensis]|uniref:hypothetical protein n=1 Tax=Methanoculleus chikugoensis TaxID=118126 RepID=UPI0031451E46